MNRLLVISPADNVGTALETLARGETLAVQDRSLLVAEPIPRGHKIALRDIAAGAPVVKYGSPIGAASAPIAAGTHVHTHNVASARGRGDLAAAARTEARIAEPPDSDALDLPVAEEHR